MTAPAPGLVVASPHAAAPVEGRLAREWFTAEELAGLGLPAIPNTKRGVNLLAQREAWAEPGFEGVHWRTRQGRGGGTEYHWSVLPEAARTAVALRFPQGEAEGPSVPVASRQGMADAFDRLPTHRKQRAERAAAALDQVTALEQSGLATLVAMTQVAAAAGVSRATLYEWRKIVRGAPRADWKYWLAPRHHNDAATEAPFSPEAWSELLGDYLRLEQPTLESCMRRLRKAGEAAGWQIPSNRTALRRIEALPPEVVTLYRHGEDALKRMYPAQRRHVHILHALQAVNADGHIWDVRVRWEDGTVGRPVMVAFQDIYSRMVLSWRIDRSENRHAVRLAFGDLVERYGIPDAAYMDNGRHFASKWICGGTATRYRFKVRDDEPLGLLTGLGVEVHFTKPYSGQSKPIERFFGECARDCARHPAFAGCWTGNSPMTKPENYAEGRAVPIGVFAAVVAEWIAQHNAQAGRRGGVALGQSYQAVFEESYARSPIRKATAEQRSHWLLMAEALTVRRDSTLELLGNRFGAEFLTRLRGTKVTARFDPDALQRPLLVYGHDGALLGEAACIDDSGFEDAAAAQEAGRRARQLLKHTKAAAALLGATPVEHLASRVAALDAAALGAAAPPPAPETRVVRPVFGNTALKEQPIGQSEGEVLLLQALRERHGPLRAIVPEEDDGGA